MSDEKTTTIEVKKMPEIKTVPSEKGFVPTKYKTQEFVQENGKPKIEEDKETGIVYKTLKLTNPLIPDGETLAKGYDTIYHKVGYLNGKRVSYVILKSDRETIINTKDVGSVDR